MNINTSFADIIKVMKERENEIRKAYQFAIDRLQERLVQLDLENEKLMSINRNKLRLAYESGFGNGQSGWSNRAVAEKEVIDIGFNNFIKNMEKE